ncbi:MAG: YceI family protein, partial [Pseudomonadota bacterium]
MKRLLIAALAVLALAPQAQADMRTYTIDPDHAAIAFKVEHIGYAMTLGQFLKTEGRFSYDVDTKELGEVVVDVDAASVFSNHKARDKHIVSKDFLWVEKTP